MTDDKSYSITHKDKEGRVVTFNDNGKRHIIESGKICITPSTSIENILLVDGLKHNLLSISQLCDRRFKVVFESLIYIITSLIDNSIVLIGYKYENTYI